VLLSGERILRGLRPAALANFQAMKASGLLDELVRERLLVGTQEAGAAEGFAAVLEHERIPFISYPYEWPFALLRKAALAHLDIHLRALERGITLSDASAYNVQFIGARPVFIDVGSFRPYREGELWAAHRQFCEHFLNPLLLASELGVAFQPWLRGSPEGIRTADLSKLLPRTAWLSVRKALHVLMPARAEAKAASHESESVEKIREARMPKEGMRLMLSQLRTWIAGLQPRGFSATTWADYTRSRTYDASQVEAKRKLVREFVAWCKPRTLWDMGCNDGEFGAEAIAAGAGRVVGFDADAGALEAACERSTRDALELLPLYQDAADPSPGAGWRGRERAALTDRPGPDAMMALAFEHHLALGRNVPLEEVVDFLVALAPRGLIEFVPKADPTVRRMLALKGDIFPDYDEASFRRALEARARVVAADPVSTTGRTLYRYERPAAGGA
jgi:ribosomal protein L11 methylase PrmA